MKKVEIVGAGLAGLTAAISLAMEGSEVTVYEKENRIGGIPSARPDPAGSPFGLSRLAAYTGIDISPVVKPVERGYLMLWGRRYELKIRPGVPLYMVERGSRASSLDSFLYQNAKKCGVRIQFGQAFETRKDFLDLPPGSIIATGMNKSSFQALGIPYAIGYAVVAKGKVAHESATVTIYMGEYTINYGFTSTINGICYAQLFQADIPIGPAAVKDFELDVSHAERFSLSPWKGIDIGVLPFSSYSTPRLFCGDKILAGTLAGAMDPLMGFGMLGAMLSGKIAALAHSNRELASREFRRLTILYVPELFIRKVMNVSPSWVRRGLARVNVTMADLLPDWLVDLSYRFVPGYGRMG